MIIIFELINKLLNKYFICFSMNDIYFDERNPRYVLATFFAVLGMTYIGFVTIIFLIDDFLIRLSI